MARANKPTKTDYTNIYEILNSSGEKEYLATWVQRGRQYPQKNLTKLYGSKTAKQASTKLNEIRVLIARGEDPFKKDTTSDLNKTLTELVLLEISDRNATDDYKYIQKKIYLKYIDPKIGHKKLKDITLDMLLDLFRYLKTKVSEDEIIHLKKTINPTLDYAADEELIRKNPLSSRKLKRLTKITKPSGKAPLKHRLIGMDDTRYLKTAQTIYKNALTVNKKSLKKERGRIPDIELQIAFLLVLMTGRRRSEVLKITYSDITKYGTVKTRIETTKSKVWEEYPIPKEVLDRLEKNGTGKILPSLTPDTYSEYIRKFIDDLNLPLHKEMKIDGHDSRNLFLTIMSKQTKNPFLCDSALSHSTKKYDMLLTYYEPDIQDYIELFEWYWDLLRGKKDLQE